MQGSEKMLNIPFTIVTSYWDLSNAILQISEKVAFRRSEFFFDHSKVRFTANPKLALRSLRMITDLRHWVCDRFAKNL
jgi:hypothetical protein